MVVGVLVDGVFVLDSAPFGQEGGGYVQVHIKVPSVDDRVYHVLLGFSVLLGRLGEVAQQVHVGVLDYKLQVAVVHVELRVAAREFGAEGGGSHAQGVDFD